jgi:DNA-binding NtrC family response regulator
LITSARASDPARILIVDDEADIRSGLRMLLSSLELDVDVAEDGAEALTKLSARGADVVLTDLQMPGMSGAELLTHVKRRWPATVVVVLTGYGTIQAAVRCMQQGASHFLTKPFDNDEICTLVDRLVRQVAHRKEPASGEPNIVADAPSMRSLMALVDRVARTPVPVLIEGETGTGKELIARTIHARSAAADRPFLAVNAAALPDTLLEAELFGHTKGAFTGADRARRGLFEEAGGGTVFLDEVASMSLAFQGKLLRVLQERVVRPLGGSSDVPVSFRPVAATNKDLTQMIREGGFREDLFYRLGVMSVRIPPLRERQSDIPVLAQHFLHRAAALCLPPDVPRPTMTDAALDALLSHNWPGNVRELQNAVQRAVVVCAGPRILPHHLGLDPATWAADEGESAADYEGGKRQAVERFQREFVVRALELTKGNVTHAAERCGLTRAALQRILRQLGIDREQFE